MILPNSSFAMADNAPAAEAPVEVPKQPTKKRPPGMEETICRVMKGVKGLGLDARVVTAHNFGLTRLKIIVHIFWLNIIYLIIIA